MADVRPSEHCEGPISVQPQENPSISNPQSQEWETKTRAWLCSWPTHQDISTNEMDVWIDSNLSSLPDHLKSLPRSQLHQRILSIHKLIPRSNQEGNVNQIESPSYRFQRTDHWKPVYFWLESLETNEVVTPDEIVEWLSKNPKVKEQLHTRYSRHHLKHYIQRCHLKMLRRRAKSRKAQKGIQVMQPNTTSTPMMVNNGVTTVDVHRPCEISNYSVKDCDISLAKKSEASLRYELLTDLQNELTRFLSRQKQSNDLKDSGSASVIMQRPAENANYQLSSAADEGNVRFTFGGVSHFQDT